MSHAVWYTPPLTCCRCRSTTAPRESRLRSTALNPDPGDRWVEPGDLLDIGLPDLAEAFVPSASWPPGSTLRVLEGWSCPACQSTQAALLTWSNEGAAGWRLLAVEAACLTPELLAGVHGVSPSLRETLYPDQLALLNPAG